MKKIIGKNNLSNKKIRFKISIYLNSTILVLLLALVSSIANAQTCRQYCDSIARETSNKCSYNTSTCNSKISEIKTWCLNICNKDEKAEFTSSCISSIAKGYAKKLWGKNVVLYDMQKYLGPNNKTFSHVFIFTNNPNVPDKNYLLNSSKYDPKEIYWDEYFRGIEIGATPGMPPIISYWDGVPAEYYFYNDAKQVLTKKYGSRSYTLDKRYLSGVFPILSFKANGRTFYFDIKTKKATEKIEIKYNENTINAPEYIDRTEAIKKQWINHLSNVREVCNGI